MKLNAMSTHSSRLRYPLVAAAILLAVVALTGCLYPKEERKQNQAVPKEAVRNVQAAVDQYKSDTGMLPIKNSSSDTPIYEKFQVDFAKLTRTGYMSDIPSASFENGGNYYFLVLDEELEPRIKLLDLLTFQKINDIQSWVKSYVQTNSVLPKGEEMYPGFYQIDYKALNKSEPVLRSVFSGQTVSAIVDDNGVVYTDYGIDIMQLIQREGISEPDPQLDLRSLLVDSTEFVPVKAPAYLWVNNEPQAVQP